MITPKDVYILLLLKKRKELGYIGYANYIEESVSINRRFIIIKSGVFAHPLHSNN